MKGQYYTTSQFTKAQFKIIIRSLVDQNKILNRYLAQPEKGQLEIFLKLQLFSHGQLINPPRYSKLIKKNLIDQTFIFQTKYKDLAQDSMLIIVLWSTKRQFSQQFPLASTSLKLFDQKYKLRMGKYHILLWPDRQPDLSFKFNKTPAFIDDQQFIQLNKFTKQDQQMEQIYHKLQQNLRRKMVYLFRIIPVAFLQIQLPLFNYPVLYQDILVQSKINYVQSSYTLFDTALVINDMAYQYDITNPINQMYIQLQRNSQKNPQSKKPSKQQHFQMQSIIKKPAIYQMKQTQKNLFFKYRYSIMNKKEYLIKFLQSVIWHSNQQQANQALQLMNNWQKIDYADSLYLLSSSFCANNVYKKKSKKPLDKVKTIRAYAVQRLKESKIEQIRLILLQLVQALRYQSQQDSALQQFIIAKSIQNTDIAIMVYWFFSVQCQEQKSSSYSNNNNIESLLQKYRIIFSKLKSKLQTYNKNAFLTIKKQQDFINNIRKISKVVKSLKDKQQKKEQLRKRLGQEYWKNLNFEYHLDPSIKIIKAIPKQSTVFSSAMAPFCLTFLGLKNQQEIKVKFMYKNGDDLRQDQLIMQIFIIMNQLLKGVNQDFRLITYKIMACSKQDGLLEFVSNSQTIQDITKRNTLDIYLQNLTNQPNNPIYKQLSKEYQQNFNYQGHKIQCYKIIMQNYLLSIAGYCAITYFLGIGDRHLENVLIQNTGKFFHIDFGFILGKDPKPYSPPIKLSKQMVDAFGGTNSENYTLFKTKCVQAYLYLRKYAKFIICLFQLMIDSGIKDLDRQALNGLANKFNVQMNDQNAEKQFLQILQESMRAIFGSINDKIHEWAIYWKR